MTLFLILYAFFIYQINCFNLNNNTFLIGDKIIPVISPIKKNISEPVLNYSCYLNNYFVCDNKNFILEKHEQDVYNKKKLLQSRYLIKKNNTNTEKLELNFLKYFNVRRINNYWVPVISYILIVFIFVCSAFIVKYNLFSKILNTKVEIFNYLSISNLLLISIYVIWWVSMLIYSFATNSKSQIMIRLGIWITLNLGTILLPILRNSIFVILFNISYERIRYIHKLFSILCILSVLIKFITVLILYEASFLIKIINPTTGGSPLMGTIATILFFVSGVSALPIIIKNKFELFYYSHRTLSLCILIFSSLHYISFLYYILPFIILYFLDLIIRLYHTNSSIYSKLQNIGVKTYGTSSTFINITFLNKINRFPGCYFFVCFYKDISRFQWHPLSMVTYSNDTITFCAKNVGNHSWTGRLFDVVNDNKIDILENKKIFIQGPYGHISVNYKNNKYETIIIIAGGIGITPLISILQDINLLYNKKKLISLKKIYFYWIISHISLYDAFKKYFVKLNTSLFEVKIYTTKKINVNEYEISDYYLSSSENNPVSFSFINEKPNITFILNRIFSKSNKNTVAFTCGPPKLTEEISDVCNRFNVDISVEVF
jgi:predicted ferric reductase